MMGRTVMEEKIKILNMVKELHKFCDTQKNCAGCVLGSWYFNNSYECMMEDTGSGKIPKIDDKIKELENDNKRIN